MTATCDHDELELDSVLATALIAAVRGRAERAEARVTKLEREIEELRALLSRASTSLAERAHPLAAERAA